MVSTAKLSLFFNVLSGRSENLPGGSDRRGSGDARLERLTDSIGIEQRNLMKLDRLVDVDFSQPLAPVTMISRGQVTEHL